MKRIWGHVAVAATLLAGGGVAVSACVHDNSTLFIRDALYPTPVASGMACIFTSDPTQTFIAGGTLDVTFRQSYTAVFLVGNQMVPQGNAATPATETSRIQIQGAIVRVTDTAGHQLASFTDNASATVDPLQGNEPGYAPVFVRILDPSSIAASGGSARLLTYTRVYGYTLGGDYVESGDFEFPVDVCTGCLIAFPAATDNPAFPSPNCANASAASSTSTMTIPCFMGQDVYVPCSLCSGINPACNPNVAGGIITDAGASPG